MIYSWQEPYISTLLETDGAKQRVHILETRAAFEQRLLSSVDDEELRAMNVAAIVLAGLERKRPHIARRISEIRTGRNPHARDLDI
jgi:hypothetical protein